MAVQVSICTPHTRRMPAGVFCGEPGAAAYLEEVRDVCMGLVDHADTVGQNV